jgi:hypothetical protein
MGRLNSANKAQRLIIQNLMKAANGCPPPTEREAFAKYQQEVLQPIRDKIVEAETSEQKS